MQLWQSLLLSEVWRGMPNAELKRDMKGSVHLACDLQIDV